MRWVQTYKNKHFDIFDPNINDICIEDIAHSLALKCRFNGHCNKFYSVAQHCVLMSQWNLPGSRASRLLHDAAEAYLPDIPSPIKQNLPDIIHIEDNLLKIILQKFSKVGYNILEYNKEVKRADYIMLATEARDLMGNPKDWVMLKEKPYHEIIVPWSWQFSEKMFLIEAKELGLTL